MFSLSILHHKYNKYIREATRLFEMIDNEDRIRVAEYDPIANRDMSLFKNGSMPRLQLIDTKNFQI